MTLSRTLRNAKLYGRAEAVADKLIEARPDASDGYLAGQHGTIQGNYHDAEADFSAAINRGWDAPLAYYVRGLARAEHDDHVGAEMDLTSAIAYGKNDAGVYHLRGLIRAKLDKLTDADADSQATIERDSQDASSYFNRGLVRYRQNDFRRAQADFGPRSAWVEPMPRFTTPEAGHEETKAITWVPKPTSVPTINCGGNDEGLYYRSWSGTEQPG